jgi:hypothetical protein
MLINICKKDNHLANYCKVIEDANNKARFDALKVKVDRDRIIQGSAYNSDDNENNLSSSSEEESDWSVSSSDQPPSDAEYSNRVLETPSPGLRVGMERTGSATQQSVTDSIVFSGLSGSPSKRSRKWKPLPFNAVRFLASQLELISKVRRDEQEVER